MNFGNLPLELQTGGRSTHIHKDVEGAPFKVGERVLVHQLADQQGDASFLGRLGTVEHYEYSCGCGQSFPRNPMIGVRFADDRLEEFWAEELWPAPS